MENYKIIIQLLIPCICLYLIFIKNILCSSCFVNYGEVREGELSNQALLQNPMLHPGPSWPGMTLVLGSHSVCPPAQHSLLAPRGQAGVEPRASTVWWTQSDAKGSPNQLGLGPGRKLLCHVTHRTDCLCYNFSWLKVSTSSVSVSSTRVENPEKILHL